MPVRHRSQSLAVLALALVVLSACGARLDASQRSALAAAGGNGAQRTTTGNNTASSAASNGTATESSSGASTGSTGTSGTATGGSGDTNGAAAGDPAAGGAAACTATPGTTGPGVTDTDITLGNISTISGPIPGFGQTGLNGVKAYIAYINSEGGVCGRQLKLETADDRLDAGQNRAAADSLKDRVLGFVGGTTVVDNGSAGAFAGTNIPATQLAIGNDAIASANIFSPNPIDPTTSTNGSVKMWEYFKSSVGVTRVAVIYPQQADASARAKAYVSDLQSAGIPADEMVVSVTETNYAGVVQQMQSKGDDGFITALEVNGMARLAQAVKQSSDFKPKVKFYGAQSYGAQFLKLAGDAAEDATIGIAYDIVEDPTNPAMARFADWYARTNPGSTYDFFSIMGWAAADMMVQALTAAGGAPTRDGVIGALRTFTSFDAHGVLAPCDPPGKHGATAFMVTGVRGGQWTRIYPESGFAAA